MKKFLILSLILFGCKSAKMANSNHKENIHRKWMITKIGDAKKSELIKNEAFIDLTSEHGSASVGCNMLGFEYEIKKGKLIAKDVITTLMYCEDLMKYEDTLSIVLRECDISIKGHHLILTNSHGTSIECIAQDWD